MPKVFASISVVVGLVLALAAAPAIGGPQLAEPEGRVILTISGAIDRTNGDALARFDRKMLEELGTTTIITTTSWTDGPQEFEGVLARDVLKAVGATGGTIAATALNDYQITIPMSDFDKYQVLFATHMNGVELTARDKGPIWIVYPRDDHKELRNQKVDAKWLWQLSKINVQ
ncbi:MAG: molybdopterin-dependent oxidoreductase [Proteobacteria bacterium]|nr:molybdopterin-dependent oxidoreductase [Pseudomonadota bacterium]